MIQRPKTIALKLSICFALLAACGSTSDGEPAEAMGDDGYPVTVTNCGVRETFHKAPERVVTIKSTATELLLALGLGDKMVGRAFADGRVATK